MSKKQTRYNQLLEAEFAKGGHIIAVGETLTRKAWDRIIECANLAADEYAKESAKQTLDQAGTNVTKFLIGLPIGQFTNAKHAVHSTEIILP